MGIRENVMNLFNGSTNTQQQRPQAASNPNPNPNPAGGGAANSGTGSAQLDAAAGAKDAKKDSPLTKYEGLWDTDNAGGGKGAEEPNPNPQPKNQNQNQPQRPDFAGFAKKVDFAKAIPRELASKALGGDIDSFYSIINSVVQASFAASLSNAHSMGEKSWAKNKESLLGELPGHFRQFQVANSGTKNPGLKHPAVQPLLAGVKQQILTKFPDASAEEIDQMAEEYFEGTLKEAFPNLLKSVGGPANANSSNRDVDPSTMTDPRAKMRVEQEMGLFDWSDHFGVKPSETQQ